MIIPRECNVSMNVLQYINGMPCMKYPVALNAKANFQTKKILFGFLKCSSIPVFLFLTQCTS